MKKILILSGKGGTGKTTTAAAFAAFSQARAIADCDVDAPNLHILQQENAASSISDFLGGDKAVIDPVLCIGCGQCKEHCRFHAIKEEAGSYHINEYACEGCGVCAYVCPQKAITLMTDVAGSKKLYLGDRVFSTAMLKMGRGNSGKLVSEVKKDLFQHAPDTDFAILDGSPGIGCPVMASITGVDLVLIVAEPSMSGLSDLKRLIETTNGLRTKVAVCVNKWNISPEHTEAIEEYCNEQQIRFAGKIPYDKHASVAINAGKSLADVDCPARDALKEIYEHIIKEVEGE